jgi:hypothetical protein
MSAAPTRTVCDSSNGCIVCESWCTDGDGHPEGSCWADQTCRSTQHKVICGLEDGAPALPLAHPWDGPGITVYARKEWHGLPHVVLNVYREHQNAHISVDTDLSLTADEAREIARNLLQVADLADEATR